MPRDRSAPERSLDQRRGGTSAGQQLAGESTPNLLTRDDARRIAAIPSCYLIVSPRVFLGGILRRLSGRLIGICLITPRSKEFSHGLEPC